MASREWVANAIRKIEADFNRSADTHLIPLRLPEFPGIDIYLKDESSHPTGSLKHRLARSLFLYALASGWLHRDTTVIEASSGSTAVSEAYFSQLLGLNFIAVMPIGTSPEKISAIEFHGGRCRLVDDPRMIHAESTRLAAETGGHFMDQFTYAERATDWRSNNNIAESIFKQMSHERFPIPDWIVCGAGTGGTTATLGRYVRYRGYTTRILCVDPQDSVFYGHYRGLREAGPRSVCAPSRQSTIEGIGRSEVAASFIAGSIDEMISVPDALSLAAMRYVTTRLGRRVGGSTGTNFVGVLALAQKMRLEGRQGSIVAILCDSGERYSHSYYNPGWYAKYGIEVSSADVDLQHAVSGEAELKVECAWR